MSTNTHLLESYYQWNIFDAFMTDDTDIKSFNDIYIYISRISFGISRTKQTQPSIVFIALVENSH